MSRVRCPRYAKRVQAGAISVGTPAREEKTLRLLLHVYIHI